MTRLATRKRNKARRNKTHKCLHCKTALKFYNETRYPYCNEQCMLGHKMKPCSGEACTLLWQRSSAELRDVYESSGTGWAPKTDFARGSSKCKFCTATEAAAKKYRVSTFWILRHLKKNDANRYCCRACDKPFNDDGSTEGIWSTARVDHHHVLHNAHDTVHAVRGIICNTCNSRARNGISPETCAARAKGTGDTTWLGLAYYLHRTGWYDKTYGIFTTGVGWADACMVVDGTEPIPIATASDVAAILAYNQELAEERNAMELAL